MYILNSRCYLLTVSEGTKNNRVYFVPGYDKNKKRITSADAQKILLEQLHKRPDKFKIISSALVSIEAIKGFISYKVPKQRKK